MSDNSRTTNRPPPARPFRTLLAEHQGRDYGELDDGRGKVRIWHLGHRIAVFESSGSICEAHSDFIIAFHKKHIEGHPRPWFTFGNWMTLLAYTPEVREQLRERITELVHAQAESFHCKATIDYQWRYPALINDAEPTAFARQVAIDWLGADGVIPNLQGLTGSEDFSFMLQEVPGCYLIVGNGVGDTHGSGGCMVHNPGYDFNDACLPIAASYWVQLARRFLAPGA